MQQRDGFGKRGRVELRPQPAELPDQSNKAGAGGLGWIGGAIAAIALAILIGAGSGSGLLSGLIGGLIGHQLAKSLFGGNQTATAQSPSATKSTAEDVKRSGFGSTAARFSSRSSGS
jgi:hypothetical protein